MRNCDWCGRTLVPPPGKEKYMRYCNHACRNNAHYRRGKQLEDEENPSPEMWDGKTYYSNPERVRRHVASCSMCGRSVSPTDVSDWYQAVQMRRCAVCQGALWFEHEDIGSIGSVDTTVPRRRVA